MRLLIAVKGVKMSGNSVSPKNSSDHKDSAKAVRLLSQWKTPANITTIIRIIMVIACVWLASLAGPWGANNYGLRWTAAILFIIAASTDKLDGYLARSRNEVTDLGKLLDPIADKLLICAMLIVFSIFGELWWWVTILFLLREIGITIWRFVNLRDRNLVIAANWPGKLKTVFECVSLSLLLIPLWQFDSHAHVEKSVLSFTAGSWSRWYLGVTDVLVAVALVLCLYSGINYLIQAHHTLRNAPQGVEKKLQ
jgi:CDP-diacylglycerol--glycerol-3-phosphate 3-phosphatidyltransferase